MHEAHTIGEAAAEEVRRIAALVVATKFSELKKLENSDLSDQLRHFKHARKSTGLPVAFTVTQKDRENYVLQLQALLTEAHGVAANDLEDGDPGTDSTGVVRKKRAAGVQGGGRQKKAKSSTLSNDCGDEWDADKEFEVEAILGTRISNGVKAGDVGRKGTVLYHIAWKGFSAAESTWEPAVNTRGEQCIHPDIISDYEQGLRDEAAADVAADAELEDSDDESEGEEA